MKTISFIAAEDNANVFTHWSSFINKYSETLKAQSICIQKHPYLYPLKHDYDIGTDSEKKREQAAKWILESDYIVYSEENQNAFFEYMTDKIFKSILGVSPIFDTKAKKIAFYSGTAYRRKSQMFNQMDTRCFDRILSPLDLYRLTNKDHKTSCIFMCEEVKSTTKNIKEDIIARFNKPTWLVSHTPTNRQVKGSDFLLKIMEKIQSESKNPIQYVEKSGLTPQESLELKSQSCFYIDTLSIGLGILATGAHGISSLEALSHGNLVFSSTFNMGQEAIEKANYPIFNENVPYPINNLGQTIDSAAHKLETILNLNKDKLIDLAISSYDWYEKTSTPQKFVEKITHELEQC